MIEKLTKSVSMSSEEVTTEVIIAAFEALLARNDLLVDYYSEWAQVHILNYGDTIRQNWIEWTSNTKVEKWMISAFDFSESHIPANKWYSMDYKWLRWCLENNVQKSISDLKSKK